MTGVWAMGHIPDEWLGVQIMSSCFMGSPETWLLKQFGDFLLLPLSQAPSLNMWHAGSSFLGPWLEVSRSPQQRQTLAPCSLYRLWKREPNTPLLCINHRPSVFLYGKAKRTKTFGVLDLVRERGSAAAHSWPLVFESFTVLPQN